EEVDKTTQKEHHKIWIVLFSCLVTRAVYLTIIPNRNTESFLGALRELSARHTEPKVMISDNEGAFIGANKVLHEISKNPKTRAVIQQQGIQWKFLPSRASWMGGIWERLVGIVKLELQKMQGKCMFNEYEWRTHLAEVEAVLNERPLTYVSDVGTEPEVVTPKAIMNGCIGDTTLGTDINIEEMFLEMRKYQNQPIALYKEKIKIKDQFWTNLKDNYLIALRNSKYKPTNSRRQFCNKNPRVGDVVIMHDDDMRLKWRMGIIHKLIPSTDGLIRSAWVKTTIPRKHINLHRNLCETFRRKAIIHLHPLELNIEDPETDRENNEQSLEVSDSQDGQDINISDTNIETEIEELEEEEWSSCGLEKCLQPSEKTLRWIQCESCKSWIHYGCVGLNENLTYEDSFFACHGCWKPSLPIDIRETEIDPELDFSGFVRDEIGDMTEEVTGRTSRKAADKCRRDLIQKIINKEI
ncbi:unnamed protein product, partial [Meganyctiphanes norvegica]